MARSLMTDVELFMARVRKTCPDTQGILVAVNWGSERAVFTRGTLKGSGKCIQDAVREANLDKPIAVEELEASIPAGIHNDRH